MAGLSLTAHCKTLTPMLSGGANPKDNFELRAQSVKGALRFWWRAFQAYDNEADLFENESHLFGGKIRDSSDPQKQKAVASSFRLNVSYDKDTLKTLEPGRDGRNLGETLPAEWGNGIRYFLFPVLHHSGRLKNTETGGRPVAKTGLTFRIRFFVPDGNEDTLADVLRSLWLLMNFGGLGGRTRRAAGCFEVTNLQLEANGKEIPSDDKNLEKIFGCIPPFQWNGSATPDQFVKKGLENIFSRWNTKSRTKACISDLPYTAYCDGLSQLFVLWDDPARARKSSAMAIMNRVGAAMQKFRKKNPHDEASAMHRSLAKAVKNGSGLSSPVFPKKTVTKAYMGMPIIYNFRDNGRGLLKQPRSRKNATYQVKGGYIDKNGERQTGADRRASPVLISCHERGGRPYAVICHLPSQLLPKDQGLQLYANYEDDKIGGLYPIPGKEFADTLIKKICDDFNHCELLFGNSAPHRNRPPEIRHSETLTKPVSPQADKVFPSEESAVAAPPEAVDPKEQKIIYLRKAEARADGLSWVLGEISGPPSGSGKKQKWPCHLWHLEGEVLKKEAKTWYVRAGQLSSAYGVKNTKGSLFLCTKQADAHTPPSGQNYLYNVSKTTG